MKSQPGPLMTLGSAPAAQVRFFVCASTASIRSSPIPPRRLLGMAPKRPCSIGANVWSVPARVFQPGLITGGRPPGRLRHLRQIGLGPQLKSLKSGRNPGKFHSAV
jgi:hypothetical protein